VSRISTLREISVGILSELHNDEKFGGKFLLTFQIFMLCYVSFFRGNIVSLTT
jgi:hypothetical protein